MTEAQRHDIMLLERRWNSRARAGYAEARVLAHRAVLRLGP